MYKCATLFLLFLTVSVIDSRSTATNQNSIHEDINAEEQPRSGDDHTYLGDLRYMYKIYQECSTTDLSSCLKLKLITTMDRVSRKFNDITLIDGVHFVKSMEGEPKDVQSEAEIEANLPRALDEKETALNNIIFSKINEFFDSHTLQIKLPTTSEIQRSFSEESRGKKKKMSGLLLIPLILGGTLVPLVLGALALLAGKALIISKLALVIAGILGVKKLISEGHKSSGNSHEVYVGGGHGSGYARSYNKEDTSQNIAYSAYAPKER